MNGVAKNEIIIGHHGTASVHRLPLTTLMVIQAVEGAVFSIFSLTAVFGS